MYTPALMPVQITHSPLSQQHDKSDLFLPPFTRGTNERKTRNFAPYCNIFSVLPSFYFITYGDVMMMAIDSWHLLEDVLTSEAMG